MYASICCTTILRTSKKYFRYPFYLDTIQQRRRQVVRFSKEEIQLILRSYRAHPTQWNLILADVKANLTQMKEPVRQLYLTRSNKQLKDRMSVKLCKLMTASADSIADDEIWLENYHFKCFK